MTTFGQLAYEAYCGCSGGKSFITGHELPSWDQMPTEIQTAWEVAATAAVHEYQFRGSNDGTS